MNANETIKKLDNGLTFLRNMYYRCVDDDMAEKIMDVVHYTENQKFVVVESVGKGDLDVIASYE